MYFRNSVLDENLKRALFLQKGRTGTNQNKQDFKINEQYCAVMEVARQKCHKRGLIMIFYENISWCVCVPSESRTAMSTERNNMQSDCLLSATLQLLA